MTEKLKKEITDVVNTQSLEECQTEEQVFQWWANKGRVDMVIEELQKRGMLSENGE